MIANSSSGNDIYEALDTAIYNEKLACDRYRNLAEFLRKAGNEAAAVFFSEQSSRELGHYNSLVKFRERRMGDPDIALGETVKWITPEGASGFDVASNIDLHGALKVVEEMETGAERFYRQAAGGAKDRELKELFGKLADDEAHHNYLARKLQTFYERKGRIEPVDFEDLGFE